MECYERNQPILDQVWSRMQRRVRAYPPPLRRLAAAWVTTLGPAPQRYFSRPDATPLLHLPIWLAEGRTSRALLDVLEATALAYATVRIADDVIDEPDRRGHPPYLLLGNALLADAMALLAGCAPGKRFWLHARAAWLLFSSETEAERVTLLGRAGYATASFRRHARKVALARIPLYAVLAQQRRDTPARLAAVDRLIDRLGEAYGLVNDVLGYARDLATGAQTYLLATARAALPAERRDDPAAVRQTLAAVPLFERFLRQAMTAHRRALADGQALGLRALADYTEQRIRRIEHHLRRATALRVAVALAESRPSK